MTERLVRDVHPAEVALPDGRVLTNVRAFVTDRRLLVYWATPNRQIVRQIDAELQQPCSVPASRGTLSANARLEVRLADGSTAWVNRGRGCGCGSVLKGLAAPVSWTGQ